MAQVQLVLFPAAVDQTLPFKTDSDFQGGYKCFRRLNLGVNCTALHVLPLKKTTEVICSFQRMFQCSFFFVSDSDASYFKVWYLTYKSRGCFHSAKEINIAGSL